MSIQRLTTKEALVESLIELSSSKPFDKITVEEIVKNCGYSKRTFYNHFADKYELAAYVYAHRLRDALSVSVDTRSFYEYECECIRRFLAMADYSLNTVRNTYGPDSILGHMVEATESLFLKLIELRENPVAITEALRFQVTYDAYGLLMGIFRWYEDGCRVPVEELARWCVDSVHPELGRAMGFSEWWDD